MAVAVAVVGGIIELYETKVQSIGVSKIHYCRCVFLEYFLFLGTWLKQREKLMRGVGIQIFCLRKMKTPC